MTPERERLRLLEAVAEAAEILEGGTYVIRGRTPEDDDIYAHELGHIRYLMECIDAIRAHDAAHPRDGGDVVEVRVSLNMRDVALQAIAQKLAGVPAPRSYEMAHYCMGLEDAAMAIRDKISVIPATVEEVKR